MEIPSRRNSLMQQLAGTLALTEVPETKKGGSIPSHDSDQSFTPVDDLLSGSSLRVPSRLPSKPLSNPKRRVNMEISPITPSKNENRIANSENKVPDATSMMRKQKRKKYKPKVVDDGESTPESKHDNAKVSPTPDTSTQGPRVSVIPEPKVTNHEAPVASKLKPTIIEQHTIAQTTPDPNKSDLKAPITVDSKSEKSEEAPVTPIFKQDLKSLNRTGLHTNGDKINAGTYLRVEKFNPEMQWNNDTVAQPRRSVRKQLKFDHEDTVLIRSEETTTVTNPDVNKFSSSHDEVIKQLQPLQEGLDSGSLASNKTVPHEEIISGKSQSPETFIGSTTSLNCPNMIKPVQLVACELNLNLGDKTETVMHRECAGTDSKLKRSEIGKVKCLIEDIDRICARNNLIYLATLCPRGVKRARPKRSMKSNFGDSHEEIMSKIAHMKFHENENALVLHQEKKEKYRGLVKLDEDSLIEWNLLMGEDIGANSAPGANPEREEKWREERDNFRKLALRFIAEMKLIQGNRCFSEWKGSVVDSVVGAFLTQNVSDHLSSSAFISLCARFPRLQNGNATWPESKSDSEWTKSCLADKSTSATNIVDTHVEVRAQKKPKVGSQSWEANKANVQEKKGWKVGSEHIDWDALRKEATQNGYTSEVRGVKTEDAADWDAVRQADMNEVAEAIHARGQDNVLAERIQNFLNRVVEDHGSIDLEWLRETPGDKAKEYLLSIYGLGLKSVECVRLLTLHQVAFPVDTNVGRIAVRLGWVPLQPLPDSVQMHLLELYPVMDAIQKYLWPRLCKLDQKTLYELHYQMITFGKVFCTKSKPNCNACPLRIECKHFRSAFASARLMLPGPQEKQENKVLVRRTSTAFENASKSFSNATDVPTAQYATLPRNTSSEPIIEEPMTPEEEQIVEQIPDIEDICFDNPDEIPTIKLNMESFVRNIEELVGKDDLELQIEDISKALVLLPPIAASIPPPQLKHSRHLRTVHEAYELPDGHPILRWLEFEERDPEDPSPYLLILYSAEKEASNGKPCDCTSCNEAKSCDFLSKEEENIFVKCSFMIPCRTAMRGSFPLNGTYFQVNEVFADHYTARNPVMIRREEIWKLTRRSVYVGSSVSTILKGLPTEEIQYCFWRGSVCVREFDRATRCPKPLSRWLHLIPTMRKKI
ncbi:hypothetical protein LUZ61_016524 [Rhynchospora tenuis]|uniref:HhH-GPD domain-containing protein n=1 Tax=Rhynchospora tenuis TaxID=198213 RepID=A0AAD6EK43_9POAL|nr:hypothetical protein LUZ61_016524 [Rhynchospora tenuis]